MPDIPEEVRNSIEFHFVENIDQVMEIALGPAPQKTKSKPTPGKTANGHKSVPVTRTGKKSRSAAKSGA
jgi:hypothetical protein